MKRVFAVIVSLVTTFILPVSTYALSESQLNFYAQNNILFQETFNDIFDEVYEVSKYYNVGLTIDDINDIKKICEDFSSDRVTSLTIDVNNNKENELDYFGKELINRAKKANIEVKANKTVYNLVKAYSENKKRKGY